MIFSNFLFNNISDFNKLIELKAERAINIEFIDSVKVSVSNNFEQKITRLVSSMANTIGGVVFLGIKTKRKRAIELENINNTFSFEWLKFILEKNILPTIENLKITEFNDGNYRIITIKVPRSQKAPHMANDNKYYSRNIINTVLLQEHEIRNLYTRNSKPELEFIGVTNTNGTPTNKLGQIDFITFCPKFLIKNSGEQVEDIYKIEIALPSSLHDVNYIAMQNYFTRYDDDMIVFSFVGKNPLFQNEIYTIAEAKLIVNANNFDDFENGIVEIKLFYSKGVKATQLNLKSTLIYNKQQLQIEQFVGGNGQLIISN